MSARAAKTKGGVLGEIRLGVFSAGAYGGPARREMKLGKGGKIGNE